MNDPHLLTDRFAVGSEHWPGISKLLEEMGEVVQVLGKLMATRGLVDHWDGTNLRTRLCEEMADLSAAVKFVIEVNNLGDLSDREQQKLTLYRKWHAEQKDKCL